MTDYELYDSMKEMGFTPHYDEYTGDFRFTEKDLKRLMPLILTWIKTRKDYVLLYNDSNTDDELVWWLTTIY